MYKIDLIVIFVTKKNYTPFNILHCYVLDIIIQYFFLIKLATTSVNAFLVRKLDSTLSTILSVRTSSRTRDAEELIPKDEGKKKKLSSDSLCIYTYTLTHNKTWVLERL